LSKKLVFSLLFLAPTYLVFFVATFRPVKAV
jgi:hypothetical protein